MSVLSSSQFRVDEASHCINAEAWKTTQRMKGEQAFHSFTAVP